ncbi:hypothetical protein V8G54_029898, partial [Vigna mungo]
MKITNHINQNCNTERNLPSNHSSSVIHTLGYVSFPTLQTRSSLSEVTLKNPSSNPTTQQSITLDTLSETLFKCFTTTLFHGFLPRKRPRVLPRNRFEGFQIHSTRDLRKARLSHRILQRQRIQQYPNKQHRGKSTQGSHLRPPQK